MTPRDTALTILNMVAILEPVSGSSSVVEHRLAKARVASSSLVSRSKLPSGPSPSMDIFRPER